MARTEKLTAIAILVALCCWTVSRAAQSSDSASEQSIKAAYLYKFAAYVEWPDGVLDDPTTPLTIAIFDADSLADELEEMTADRTIGGRAIAVRRIHDDDALAGVHILFVAASGTKDLPRLARLAREQSVLVVTEEGDALDLGSVINFRPVDHRIRFEVSLDAADKSRLRLSSRLLAVAEHVEPRVQ
jgi:YfiR/HmsC-like